jgi:hypothetical protein
MQNLIGSEKQVAWANKIKATVLQYLEIEKSYEMNRYQKQITEDPQDVSEDARPLRLKLQRIAVITQFISEQTSATFFIDNFKNYSEFKTFEIFLAHQKSKLTTSELETLYKMHIGQIATDCYFRAEEIVKKSMQEHAFYAAARNMTVN